MSCSSKAGRYKCLCILFVLKAPQLPVSVPVCKDLKINGDNRSWRGLKRNILVLLSDRMFFPHQMTHIQLQHLYIRRYVTGTLGGASCFSQQREYLPSDGGAFNAESPVSKGIRSTAGIFGVVAGGAHRGSTI